MRMSFKKMAEDLVKTAEEFDELAESVVTEVKDAHRERVRFTGRHYFWTFLKMACTALICGQVTFTYRKAIIKTVISSWPGKKK